MVVIASMAPLFLGLAAAIRLAFCLVFARFLPASQTLRRLEML